jgi:hypothetical protein
MKTTEQKGYSTLTKREKNYFDVCMAKYLVLNIIGPPGDAKSATIKSIADKMEYELIDLRLATMDECDLGVFPYLKERGEYKVNAHAIPEWADVTTDLSKNFIIVFEELNRASKSVRDAALGVLLERRIGPHFTFGNNVLMCSTGNLGTEDGTEVEELDTALKSRLITVQHDIPLDEWIESYAKTNVHQDIVRYLEANPTHFKPELKKQDSEGRVIVNPRTWTGLSKFIVTHYGMESTVDQYGGRMDEIARLYIGSTAVQWLRWLRDHQRITMKDVMTGKVKEYKNSKGEYLIERENLNEVVSELKAYGILNINDKEMKHVIKLLRSVDADVMYGGVWDLFLSGDHRSATKQTDSTRTFVKEFKKEIESLIKKNEQVNEKKA